VWVAIVLSMPRQCEKPEKKGKANIVPTPYFYLLSPRELREIISKIYGYHNF